MEITEKINEILREYSIGSKLQAYKKLKKIFSKYKTNSKIRYNLAVMEKELGFKELAREKFKLLVHQEDHLKSMINLYLLDIKDEKYLSALKIMNLALQKDSTQKNVLRDKAFILYKIQNIEESQKICLSLLQNNTQDYLTLNILGLTYFNKKNFKKAEDIFLKGLKINQNSAALLNSLGRLYHELRQVNKAENIFLKALAIEPSAYATLNNLAGLYLEEGLYDKAISYYNNAKDIYSNNSIILMNLAKAYFNLDNLELAENFCTKALKIDNSNEDVKKTYSLILLRKQEYSKAWKFFDGRLGLSEFSKINLSLTKVKHKLLNNNQLPKESKILVLREQGVGDEILYGTIYKDFLKNYENVTIECDERLISIFQDSFDKKHKNKFKKMGTISNNKSELDNYDCVLYAGSLGKFFRNNIKDFKNKNYLCLNKNLITQTKKRITHLTNKLNIGISWRSFKNRYAKEKSLDLEDLLNVFQTPNCNFINVQYGNVSDEISKFCSKNNIVINTIDNINLYDDLVGVASLLKNLDLFISVSNSTAHLAGGLGVKTLLIKPFNHATYHYWNQPSSKTPWYNSIELIDKKTLIKEKNILKKILN